jgi:aspartyl-tRNA(Asn)/glutamyl-tRNA(Gln) amidotransferase subunit A
MDHPGAMARCIRDVAALMQAIAYPRPESWTCPLRDLLLPGVFGRPRGFFDRYASEEVRATMDRVCDALMARGATVEEVALPAAFEEVVVRHRVVMAVEAAMYHQERLRRHPEDYDPKFTSLLEEGIQCPASEYARCKQHQEALREEMRFFARGGIDCLICPATTMAAPDATTTGDPAFNSPWSYTGMPSVSFPVAFTADGLPLAVQLIGDHGAEAATFRAAAWCEDVLAFHLGEPPVGR